MRPRGLYVGTSLHRVRHTSVNITFATQITVYAQAMGFRGNKLPKVKQGMCVKIQARGRFVPKCFLLLCRISQTRKWMLF